MPTIRDKLKKIVRSDRRNKKALQLKDTTKDLNLDPGSGFDAAIGLQPPLSATTRPSTAVSAFAPRLETPPTSPTTLLPPSPPFSRTRQSRSRSTTSSSRPESSDSYTSSLANQSQTAATSNITTPPNGLVASTPTSGGSRMSLSRFKWGSRISLRSSYSGASDAGDREGRKMSRDSGLAVTHGELGTSLGNSHIPLIEENPPNILSEENEYKYDHAPNHIDLEYDFERIREEVGLQEANNYFGRYLNEENHYTGRSPYGQYQQPGSQEPDSTFDSLQSPVRNRTFFGEDSDSETSSNYEKSFVSHDTSSLHNYISQFTAEDYRSAVGNIPRPPSRTSSECLPLNLDRETCFFDQDPEHDRPHDEPRLEHQESQSQQIGNHLAVTPRPSPRTSVSFERTVFPPIVHESYQEQATEIQNTRIIREIHTHEYREIEVPIKDERPDIEKTMKSPVHLIRDGEGNLWPMISDESSRPH